MTYIDGEERVGKTYSRVEDRYLAWSVKHDNRRVQNDETVGEKKASYQETYSQIETLTSADLMQRFTATAQGEFSGIGGSVSSVTEARAHSEVATNKYNLKKEEVILDNSARIYYPGPVYRDDYDENGLLVGRTLVQEGEIWQVDRPIEVVHTVTPVEQDGTWDAAIKLDLENWAGNYGVLPDGEHWNVFEFANLVRTDVLHAERVDLAIQVAPRPPVERRIQARAGMAGGREQPLGWACSLATNQGQRERGGP